MQIIAVSGAVTFVFSNLIGLAQTKAQRLLGYSSIGQMGLLSWPWRCCGRSMRKRAIPLVVGGLFVNHLFAKAGLFWLAGIVGKRATRRLVGARRASGPAPGVRHSSGRHRGPSAVSRLLGEMASGDESRRGRTLCLDRGGAARLAAGSGLSVPLVRPASSTRRSEADSARVLAIRTASRAWRRRFCSSSAGYCRGRPCGHVARSGCSCRSARACALSARRFCPAASKACLVLALVLAGGLWLIARSDRAQLPLRGASACRRPRGCDRLPLSHRPRRGFYPLLAVMLLLACRRCRAPRPVWNSSSSGN